MVSTHSDLYRRIIKRLVRARKEAGVTQVQLAELMGWRQTFVSKYELGERRLDVAEYIQICRSIGVDPYKLLKRAEKG